MKKLNFILIIFILFQLNISFAQNGDIWNTYTSADGLVSNVITTIMESSDGTLWIGTVGGINLYSEGNMETISTIEGAPDEWITSILESSKGALWFGTRYGGIFRYFQRKWTHYTKENTNDKLVSNTVYTIIESSDSTIWIGTDAGISRYYKEMWEIFNDDNGRLGNHVRVILELSKGSFIFGSNAGTYKYDDEKWDRIGDENFS